MYTLSNLTIKYPFSNSQIRIIGNIIINSSDVVLITGRSGCGKSTLLYALKGLFPEVIAADIQGDILFNDMSINSLSKEEKLKIGLISQNPDNQMLNRQVIDELAFGLENLQIKPDAIKLQIEDTLNRFNLKHLLNREINTLSGGEKQKVALLSVILTNPDVILLDEPTAFLDPESAKSFMELIHELRKGKTIIIIEHNIHYVADIINRCFTIEDDGTIHEINFSQYKLSVEDIISTPKPNNISLFDTVPPLLEVKNLSFGYSKNEKIIDNLSFSVYPGEIVGIIGRSGAGKSTLLKLLSRFIKTHDSVFLNTREINSYTNKEFYSQLGLLFQNPENHFLFDSVAKEVNDDKKILEFFELNKVKQQNPFTLSEGQKRRLSFAILKSTFNRTLYLFDEPTFGQDMMNKDKIIQLIQKMQQDRITFIIVSHDYAFINKVCNRIIYLTRIIDENNKTK
ncbi:MAG: ABC transporter ATP-binding protein [Neisseriaceae bacterium]